MTEEYLDNFANQNEFISAMKVSAKTGDNVAILFSKLVREILLREFRFDSEVEGYQREDIKRSLIEYDNDGAGRLTSFKLSAVDPRESSQDERKQLEKELKQKKSCCKS